MRHAATVAQAIEFIDQMPDGFASPISQGGINLSGGQKQRLSIARALVRRAGDLRLRRQLLGARLRHRRAAARGARSEKPPTPRSSSSSQRIGTVMNADRIVVLDDGRVVGIGTHAELLKTSEVYREIVASQVSLEEVA